MATLFQRAAFLMATAGVAMGLSRGTKESAIPAEPLKLATAIPVEIVENGQVTQKHIVFEEEVEPRDHLAETNYIRNEILRCLQKKTALGNPQVFYTSMESYLRNRQSDVIKDPNAINDIRANITAANEWFRLSKNLATSDFKNAFATSELEVAQQSRQR